MNMLMTVIRQLKWIPRFANVDEFAKAFLDIVQMAAPNAQRELITCLPEVIPDSKHSLVVETLKSVTPHLI